MRALRYGEKRSTRAHAPVFDKDAGEEENKWGVPVFLQTAESVQGHTGSGSVSRYVRSITTRERAEGEWVQSQSR